MPEVRTRIQAALKYPNILEMAWGAAKAPRAKDAPTVVSLFAGCGGSSLGYAMAGYREMAAVEWDDHAAGTFAANFPGVPLHHGDIASLGSDSLMAMARMKPGQLDVLDGSPPCQGFSTAGTRRKVLDDPRNQLFRQYIRMLTAFKPKAIVLENVSGLVKGRMKETFCEIVEAMRAAGYDVAARLLNAMWYGVPQDRARVIFVGIRRDLGISPSHPMPSCKTPVTFREAVIGAESVGPPLRGKMAAAYDVTIPGDSYADTLGRLGARESYYSVFRLAWDRPSRTIVKTVSPGFNGLAHPSVRASISIAAIKRLASFPDGFRLDGKFEDQWARVGNSVPPLFMRAIAGHLRNSIGI